MLSGERLNLAHSRMYCQLWASQEGRVVIQLQNRTPETHVGTEQEIKTRQKNTKNKFDFTPYEI